MIRDVAGISRIDMLYLQLLYSCNFDCAHCFHGERLRWRDAYTLAQAESLIELMQREYRLQAVTLLGGEPFLYTRLRDLIQHVRHTLGLRVEICTNGYRIDRRLADCADGIDLLRVSLEGLEPANDRIRRPGSFAAAIRALDEARRLSVPTGVTMTVTNENVEDVMALARLLQDHGVQQLKLHCLRLVGNAADRPDLQVADPAAYTRMHQELAQADLDIVVTADDDLAEHPVAGCMPGRRGHRMDRIETDPRGALTMSCKAVGKDAHAFWYDKERGSIIHRPSGHDELVHPVGDVVYSDV